MSWANTQKPVYRIVFEDFGGHGVLEHNLGTPCPVVCVYDSMGNDMSHETSVQVVDSNRVTVNVTGLVNRPAKVAVIG